jgi:hypothetical protein
MFNNARQEHNQTGGQTFSQRLSAVGYSGTTGENIFTYAEDVVYGHAGFEIDWADPDDPTATYGMQTPRGHRDNIHSGTFREIGIGVINGTNTVSNRTVGPQIVTQDFGTRATAPYYGTGVAYYDLDGDNNYDVGEGIPGLTVTMSGASHYCITADGGGWTIPLPSGAAGNRTVTFTSVGIDHTVTLNVPANSNAKADLKLVPPTFTSPPLANKGQSHTLHFTSVPLATAYNYTSTPLSSAAAENCENLTNATATTSPGYSVVQSAVKYEGTNAWRTTFVSPVTDQFIQLNGVFLGVESSTISFRSRLGQATIAAFARVQVKEEGTSDWMNVYSQQGTGTSGETTFQERTASLGPMNGKRFRIRFMFDATGTVNVGTGANLGWYIDAIRFTNVYQPGTVTTGSFTTNTPSLAAPAALSWIIQIDPVVGGNVQPGSSQTLRLLDPNRVLDLKVFSDWAAHHEAHGLLWPGALTANSDPDGDGRSSALEFAFGTNPVVADGVPSGYPSIQPSATHFVLRYEVDTALNGLTVTPEAGTSASAWFTPGQPGAPAWFTDSLISTSGTLQTREAKVPFSSGARGFLRLRVMVP